MNIEIDEIKCPVCTSQNIKKSGIKKNKLLQFQKYFCINCEKTFVLKPNFSIGKTYPLNIILNSVSLYNKGFSQNEVIKELARKFKIKPSQKTVSNWINEFKNICTFNNLREKAIKLFNPNEMVYERKFEHNNLPYKFQVHRAKIRLLFKDKRYNNKFSQISKFEKPVINYLRKILTNKFPHHIFHGKEIGQDNLERSSQLIFETLSFSKIEKNNLANKLTKLSLNLAKNNKQRHEVIQDFIITNDSSTIATEVPVYLTKNDISYFEKKGFFVPFKDKVKTPITGHIDILQIRNGLIHILDYKPNASIVNPINQLTVYALALASRTQLAVKDFKCAWFDNQNYYEFFPLHVVYKLRKKTRKIDL